MVRKVTQEDLGNAQRFGEFAPVFKIDAKTVVKSSTFIRLAEAETMRYVRARTSIPVPEVYDAYIDEDSGHTRIVMEFVEGIELEEAWDTYQDSDKESVIAQLKGYMDELRAMEGDFIGAVDGSWCNDHFFDEDRGGYGPFKNEREFNDGIVRALKQDREDHVDVDVTCNIFLEVMKGHKIVLTHNDFAPRNILVQGSKVVAVLDWEHAGWYPDYWEYCKAMRRPDWQSGWIQERALDQILEPCLKELSVMWNTTEIIW
ncbi:kinase-like protein [Xylariaceae sp. FL1272]|nr:kinase-like protein [Xylariaceae sp. FL1272]